MTGMPPRCLRRPMIEVLKRKHPQVLLLSLVAKRQAGLHNHFLIRQVGNLLPNEVERVLKNTCHRCDQLSLQAEIQSLPLLSQWRSTSRRTTVYPDAFCRGNGESVFWIPPFSGGTPCLSIK